MRKWERYCVKYGEKEIANFIDWKSFHDEIYTPFTLKNAMRHFHDHGNFISCMRDISIRGLIENCGNRGQKLQRNKRNCEKMRMGRKYSQGPLFPRHFSIWQFRGHFWDENAKKSGIALSWLFAALLRFSMTAETSRFKSSFEWAMPIAEETLFFGGQNAIVRILSV